jgi:hypothetical protein
MRIPIIWDGCLTLGVAIIMLEALRLLALVFAVPWHMRDWRLDYFGPKDKHRGTVEAPDEKSAIAEAMRTFHITPARRRRILVKRVEANRE